MTAASTSLRRDAHVIGLVGFAHGVSHFFQLCLPPLFPLIKAEFGVGYAQLGLLMSAYYLTSGVGQALAGFVVDRVGSVRVLLGGFVFIVGGTAIAAIAPSYLWLAPAAMLMGLGNSVFHPADFAALNHRVSATRLGHAFSTHALTGSLGYSVAPVLMVALAVGHGWRRALAIAAVLGAMMALTIWWQRGVLRYEHVVSESAPTTTRDSARNIITPLLTPAIAACFAFFICAGFALIGTQSFAPAMFAAVYGVTPMVGAGLLTAFLLASAAGMFAGGFVVSATTHHERVAAVAMASAAVFFALFASAAIPVALLLPVLCAAGFALGISYPARDMLARSAAPKGATGRTYGIVYSGVDIGAATGPAVLGWLLDHGRPEWAFLAVAIVLAANVAFAFQAAVRRRAAAQPESA
jgi:MFS family permease